MSTKMFEIQQKIFQSLQANQTLIAKVVGVYDFVPEKTPLPYVTFGKIGSLPLTSKIENGESVIVTIDIWSEGKGRKEVVDIMSEIENILKNEISLSDSEVLSQKIINREVWEETYGLFTGTIDVKIEIMWEEI